MIMVKVLYEDNHLIAVFKPASVLTQGDNSGDACLMDEVKKYLKEKYKKPGNVFLGLLHRLDRPVSGVVLFAKTSKGASRLSEQIRNHQMKKEYMALVEGALKEKKGELENYLLHDEKTNKAKIFNTPPALRAVPSQEGNKKSLLEEGGEVLANIPFKRGTAQLAILFYEVVEKRGKNTLVKIDLETGRHHQIRAQFAHLGHPIVGDVKYGAKSARPDGAIALCATGLEFKTATGGEKKKISVPFDL